MKIPERRNLYDKFTIMQVLMDILDPFFFFFLTWSTSLQLPSGAGLVLPMAWSNARKRHVSATRVYV